MRTYKFEYKNDDDPDFPEHTKYYNKFESYQDVYENDISEFVDEAVHFMLARGFSSSISSSIQYIHWFTKHNKPEYTDEFLVTLKGSEYASVARYNVEDDTWDVNEEEIVSWADMPKGYAI